jgi:sigma-B regulation protein RsbU (phosphoserine phosphatase)
MNALPNTQLRRQLLDRRQRLTQTIRELKTPTQLVGLLKEVEAALERIDNGSYGICEVCNEPIEDEYLAADPLVRICLTHLSDDQQRAIERDLELAYRIQGKFLPSTRTEIEGWETCYQYEPAGPVSGDYCDIVKPENAEGEPLFLLGDVSGKGVAASLLMSNLHAIFRTLNDPAVPLKRLIERANRVFSENTLSTHFATLVCGRLKDSGKIEICNAGHCPPLLVHDGIVTPVLSTGLPLGLFFSAQYDVRTIRMEKGDTLLLYTDGLTEMRNGSDEEYGDVRLSEIATHSSRLPLQSFMTACLEDAKAFRGNTPKVDDLTIMLLQRSA